MNKKVIFGLSLVLVALFAIIAGSTFAWLTDKGDSNTITYNVGKVDYEISLTTAVSGQVVPGDTLTPTFTITNNSTVATNIRVKVEVTSNPTLTNTQLVVTPGTGWVLESGYYYYGTSSTAPTSIAVGDKPVSPIGGLKLDGPSVGNSYSGTTITVKISWEVKQAANVDWADMGSISFETGLVSNS